MQPIVVAALYKFALLPDFKDYQAPLLATCRANNVKGTLLLAQEGINGTIAGNRTGIDAVIDFINQLIPGCADLEYKESRSADIPFYRMKVRLKREIVTMGVPNVDPNKVVGTYVDPQNWNEVISDPDTIVIDTRNAYEVAIGTFRGAVNPSTKSFREFPKWVSENAECLADKKIAIFCTGGIRCEKASSYLMGQAFDNVYHLKGGILKYLEMVDIDQSHWEGECFVFDNRVSVGHGLKVGSYDLCRACRRPINENDKTSSHYRLGVSCPNCFDRQTDEQRQGFLERQKQVEFARARGAIHIGDGASQHKIS